MNSTAAERQENRLVVALKAGEYIDRFISEGDTARTGQWKKTLDLMVAESRVEDKYREAPEEGRFVITYRTPQRAWRETFTNKDDFVAYLAKRPGSVAHVRVPRV